METILIVIIVGLAAAYLLRKFYLSVQNKAENACVCGCTSCPKENYCSDPPPQSVNHIK
jgi:hypothetical protein